MKTSFVSGRKQSLNPITDHGIIIFDVDAEPLEHAVRKAPRRHVDAIADKDVSARFRESQKCRRDGAQSRRGQECLLPPFKFRQRKFQRTRGRIGGAAIGIFQVSGLKALSVGEENRRPSEDWRVDETRVAVRVAAELSQGRRGRQIAFILAVLVHDTSRLQRVPSPFHDASSRLHWAENLSGYERLAGTSPLPQLR